MKNRFRIVLVFSLMLVLLVSAGCGGGNSGGASRINGLAADAVVKTFFEAAKAGDLNQAGLYLSKSFSNDPRVLIRYLSGQTGFSDLKDANLLAVKQLAVQGDYAVVLATLQPKSGSAGLVIKPVGLERVGGEWYIVDSDKIVQDAKYAILQQLLSRI